MLRKLKLVCVFLAALGSLALGQASRHFTFHYAFTVQDISRNQRVRIWFPAAHSDAYQDVRVLSASGDLPLKRTHEARFQNEMYYAESAKPQSSDLHFEVVYDVVRHEHLTLGLNRPHLERASLSKRENQQYLSPDRLVPISGRPAELARMVSAGKSSCLDKARAIYDYVFDNMRYDKSGSGWGQGDVLYACRAKQGNCTDFHSLFIAMARSQGIPAKFEIGFPLPHDLHSGSVPGYHCWAEFFDPDHLWVPVDISEAWKHPNKKDYFFGAHDADRVQFSVGRDLKLNPAQQGMPLNYFVYPYVEVNGQEYPKLSMDFSFADVSEQNSVGGLE